MKSEKYDLESRTFQFAKEIREFIKEVPRTLINFDDLKQLLRSSGSVGANYREANEAISRKDFLLRVKICRKEAKESTYWLNLIVDLESILEDKKKLLINESIELTKIFGAIVSKMDKKF